MTTPEALQEYVHRVLEEQQRGVAVGFATVERESGRVIGGTRFMNIEPANRKVEIGSTWIVPPWQRSAVNTEAKYRCCGTRLKPGDACAWSCSSDALNQKSRKAILRIGAKEEGTMRKHIRVWDGRQRDTVCFSIGIRNGQR